MKKERYTFFKGGEFDPLLMKVGSNTVFIDEALPQHERLIHLNRIAIQQMQVLEDANKKYLK